MTIKKFQGKTEEEATAKAKEEFGPQTVIMNVKEIKPKGFFRSFRSSTYEVTAAIEETETTTKGYSSLPQIGNINVTADEPISIPKPEPVKEKLGTIGNPWGTPMNPVDLKEKKKENNLEEKLETLQSLLEKKLVPQEHREEVLPQEVP
ncbi:MAG: flagellar biosynthesis protein FlhF, partial [Lachnospiraceae bacterium]